MSSEIKGIYALTKTVWRLVSTNTVMSSFYTLWVSVYVLLNKIKDVMTLRVVYYKGLKRKL